MSGSVAAPDRATVRVFPRPARLRGSRDVRAVFSARRAKASPVAVVHRRSRGDYGPPRYTVVAGKALGGAVVRNRAKRRLRAAVQGLALIAGTDYVIVARAGALTKPFGQVRDALGTQVSSEMP